MDPTQSPVTLLLLLANVLVSVYAFQGGELRVDRFALRPWRVLRRREYYRLFTAGFVHASGSHLLFNMITLFFFGPWLEAALGPVRFLVLYFGSDLAAQGLTLFMHRANPRYAAVGASGAISGVLFGFCLYEPLRLLYLFFAIPIPALLFAVGFVAISIYAMRSRAPDQVGGLAHEAHLGGAAGGVLLTMLLDPRALWIFLAQLGI
ncbi:rhomboid family intramembrane serine protease [Alkalilimnicola sp. S0819]|uniref:rhomboid family intramembrane serine protease n=1 Tax=Alkalilimnicola sp. S0819 TaxID=2613922 RepID=UPI001261B697|nr:rhomboid family intramembrane serine protease [Alkalilimnicola sp. S0819]KAB7624076.1 rhomboid family intramembrane serine protease [Alkalilimnicola sp. S0819]MPQ16326.1 rhomboid family intramembrane serine protease [Alkalilimnicola sp. S0819]